MTPIAKACAVLVAYEYLRSAGLSRREAIGRSVMAVSRAEDATVVQHEPVAITDDMRAQDLAVARELSPMLWYGAAARRWVPDPDVVH